MYVADTLLHLLAVRPLVKVGVGFTVMVKVVGVPAQVVPLVYTGVTVTVAVIGAVVAFVVTKDAIFPVPLATSPMAVLLFVQLYTIVPPVAGLVKVIAVVVAPLHIN